MIVVNVNVGRVVCVLLFFFFGNGMITGIITLVLVLVLWVLFPSFMFLLFVAGFIWLFAALFKMMSRDDRNDGE